MSLKTKTDKTLEFARMLIDAGFIDESLTDDIKRVEFDDDAEALGRIEDALSSYREEEHGEGASNSELSAAELIGDPKVSGQARQAAIHGDITQFLTSRGIIGRPEQLSPEASALAGKLAEKISLAGNTLRGIAKAAHAAASSEKEAMQITEILITMYGDLLSRVISLHFHPAQARAILDEFFSLRAFMVLSRMRSFDTPQLRHTKYEDRLAAVVTYILDLVKTEEMSETANNLMERMATDPAYKELSEWERSELAHYASVKRDSDKALVSIERMLKSRHKIEEESLDTAFDNVSNDVSRIAQFASDEEDAVRVANLIVRDARETFRFTIEGLDDAYSMRLSVLAAIYASRMGVTKTKEFAARISDNFASLQKHVDSENRLGMELAFKASLSSDKIIAKKNFIRSRRILESAGREIEEFMLSDDDRNKVLMSVAREISLEDLDNMRMTLDLAKTTARQAAQKIRGETASVESEEPAGDSVSEEKPMAEVPPRRFKAPPPARRSAAREVPLEPVPIGPVVIGDGPYKQGDPMPEGVMKAIASIEQGFSNLSPEIQREIAEDIWNAGTSSEENMRLIFRDGRFTVAALSHWRATAASIDRSVEKTLIGDREPTLGKRILPDDSEGDVTEYVPRIIEEMRGIDTLFAKLSSDTQTRIAMAIVTTQGPLPFQDGKLTVKAVQLGHGLARGQAKKIAQKEQPVTAKKAKPIVPSRPTPPIRHGIKSRASVPPPSTFDLRRKVMDKFNFGSTFIDEATTRMSEMRDAINSREILITLINKAVQYLKEEFGVRSSAAFAMIEERLLSNADHYFERITALPLRDHDVDVLRQAIGGVSYELTQDISKSSLNGHDIKVREVAIRLSKLIDAEDAVHMAETLAPFLVDDDDCERVIDNYKAVLAYLKGSVYKDAAKQIARGVRLEGDAESAIESTKRYTRHLTNIRSQPQFKGIDIGRVADIFNLALEKQFEYELAMQKATEIVGLYMNALRMLGQHSIWHGEERLALLVSHSDDTQETLEFVMDAYSEVVGYLRERKLSRDVEGELAAVICGLVLNANRTHGRGPSPIMRIHAATHFDRYNDIYKALVEGGVDQSVAAERAIALTSVYDKSRMPFMIRQEITKRAKPEGEDDGGGEGGGSTSPVAGGGAQHGTPSPASGGPVAKSSFGGIVRNTVKTTQPCDESSDAQMAQANPILFPGVAYSQTAMILGARVALAASAV